MHRVLANLQSVCMKTAQQYLLIPGKLRPWLLEEGTHTRPQTSGAQVISFIEHKQAFIKNVM